MDCWRLLGISPSSDTNTIRKAYAEKVKQCHPEEHPQEFRELNDAYKRAIATASRQTLFVTKEFTSAESETQAEAANLHDDETMTEEQIEERSESFDFREIGPVAGSDSHDSTKDVLREMSSLIERKVSGVSVWKAFLHSERFAQVMEDPRFVGEFTTLLRQHLLQYKLSIWIEIERAYFSDCRHDPQKPPYRQLSKLIEKCKSDHKKKNSFKSYVKRYRIAFYILITFIILMMLMVIDINKRHTNTSHNLTSDFSVYEKYLTNPITPPPIVKDILELPSQLPEVSFIFSNGNSSNDLSV